MKKLLLSATLVATLSSFSSNLLAQAYTGVGYAGGVAGTYYTSGAVIDPQAPPLNWSGTPGFIDCRYFDIADAAGPDLSKDRGVTFQTLAKAETGFAATGGLDIRGYVTLGTDDAAILSTVRINGGPSAWRNAGQMCRYTVECEEGVYNFVWRGRISMRNSQNYTVKIFDPTNMSKTIYDKKINLTDSAGVTAWPELDGPAVNNVKRISISIGSGGPECAYFAEQTPITIPAGKWVIEISQPDLALSSANQGGWGELALVKALATGTKALNLPDNSMQLAPNPASEFVNLTFDATLNASGVVSVRAIDGKVVATYTKAVSQNNLTIETLNLQPGLYTATFLSNDNKTITKRFVKK